MRSADFARSDAAWVLAGAAFRLFMQVRILVAAVTVLLIPRDQLTPSVFGAICAVALLSFLAVLGWERFVPRLMKHPALLGLDVLLASGVLAIGGIDGPFFIFTVMTSTLAGVLYGWRGMLVVCLLQISLYYAAASTMIGFPFTETQVVISMPAFYPVAGFAGAGLRRLLENLAALDAARIDAEVRSAAANERSRLAREMHDSLAKTLRGLALSAAAIPRWVRKSPERAEEEARRVASAVEIASREARSLIADLREDAVQEPLGQAIRSIVAAWRSDTELEVDVETDEAVDLPLLSRYETVAILKELLTNIERHSGADRVEVVLRNENDHVVLTVRDNGKGLEQQVSTEGDLERLVRSGHYGIVGMHERAKRAGGELIVVNPPGTGVTATIRMAAGPAKSESADPLKPMHPQPVEAA